MVFCGEKCEIFQRKSLHPRFCQTHVAVAQRQIFGGVQSKSIKNDLL